MLRQTHQVRAYVLHQQEWRDTGRIFELLTREHGRISVFAQGIRGPKARLAAVMQPFAPLRVSWAGRGEAPRLTGAEPEPRDRPLPVLPAARLMSAWYLSELVMKLTLRLDPQPEIFTHYEQALLDLREAPSHERSLRVFEKRLLDVLGYGIPREQEPEAADPLGLARLPAGLLRRLADEDLDDPQSLEQIRPVLRRALELCLEGRDLRTRSVAQSLLEMKRAVP
jgi:DNA repair protein RecO (recombination protein O)